MSRSATLSLLGLYEWDSSLFDLLVIPEDMDRNTLIQNILAETAELEVLYPNPTVLKNLIGVWSNRWNPVWEKLYSTTQYEYDPIENYNRYEEGTTEGEDSTTHSGTDTRTISRTRSGSDTNAGTGQDENYVAGYDSSPSGTDDGLVKSNRDQSQNSNTITYGSRENISDATQHGERVASTREGGHTLHAHGNIGTMSTQEMIERERNIDTFNVYDIIIDEFKHRFCVLVY